MKKTVAEYIAEFLVDKNIKNVFTVVGGGAMYLNDAFGSHKDINCIYNHHEQASAMAAEGYARINDKPAVVCVTSGPGGTNAMTGVLGAYQDNIPMIVISGQVRYETTVESTGLKLRQFGEQEYTIIESVKPMTKYSCMIKNPNEIKYQLEKAVHISNTGRKGPVWLDIPLDIQSSIIEVNDLYGYTVEEEAKSYIKNIKTISEEINKAKRPVILAGSAIRSSGIRNEFLELVNKLNIPVISATSVSDIMENKNKLYFGNFGVFGGRAGNFIVQNADLVIGFGCRMAFKHIGFNYKEFSKHSKKIIIDIEENELLKKTIDIDIPICADISKLIKEFNNYDIHIPEKKEWMNYCKNLKEILTIYQDKFESSIDVNPYYFMNKFNEKISNDSITIVGNSGASVCALQMGIQNKNQRLFGNVNCGSMGYDLPASIGASVASKKDVFCITGDGSIQMNIQELQTIKHNKLPIKIVIFNNGGYQSIVNTQNNFFNGKEYGCTNKSGISMPSFKKLADAYDFPYVLIKSHSEIDSKLDEFINIDGFAICEVIQSKEQLIEPRVRSKHNSDGSIYSPPIDDLYPFLDEDEYKKYSFSN
nr:thiamine pyrophosphate-binding protein [uncultured Romboutsia sp.]